MINMPYYLLQAEISPVVAAQSFATYGPLGVITMLMIGVVLYMEKQRSGVIGDLKLRISQMDAKIEAQAKEQIAQQQNHVNFIKTEYANSMELNRRCLEVLDDVKEVLRNHRHQ